MSYIGKQPTKAPLTASDIEDGIITAAKIEDGAVVAAEIASNAVTTAKINADAVTGAKIADDAINSEHYTDGSVDTAHIADANVTTAKIADDAITAAKINNDIISGATELASEPADTDEFLVSDAGTLKRIDYSLIKGGGITMADQFRLSTNVNASSQSVDFTSNLERVDTSGQGTLGSSLMSESSGIFTFPSTGIYLVRFDLVSYVATATRYLNAHIMLTTNNSSYSIIAEGRNGGFVSESSSTNNQANAITLLDITDTSNQKIKFQAVINQTSSNGFYGSTTLNRTTMTFIRLGDT